MASGSIKLPKAQTIYSASFPVDSDFTVDISCTPYCGLISVNKNDTTGTVTKRQNWTQIGTLPTEVCPALNQIIKLYSPADNVLFATIQILVNGTVRVITPAVTTAIWLQGSGVFAL